MRFASICLKPLTPRKEKKTVHLQVFMDTWKKQHPPKGKVSFNKRKEQKQKYFSSSIDSTLGQYRGGQHNLIRLSDGAAQVNNTTCPRAYSLGTSAWIVTVNSPSSCWRDNFCCLTCK